MIDVAEPRVSSQTPGGEFASTIDDQAQQSDARRLTSAITISRVRWVFVPLALIIALVNKPAPHHLGAYLVAILILCTYNLGLTLHSRLPPRMVQPLIAVAMTGDVLAATGAMLDFAHDPLDVHWALLMLLGPATAVLYGWRGVVTFGPMMLAGFLVATLVGGQFTVPNGTVRFLQKLIEVIGVTVFVGALVAQNRGQRRRAETERQNAESSHRRAVEAQRLLATANEQLRRISELEAEGLSNVSHEFRTALTGIQGFSEVLRDEEVTPAEVKEYAQEINADALRLNRLITNMLDLDRLQSNRATLNLDLIDINQILRAAAQRGAAAVPGHDFVLELDNSLPAITADFDRITQVVANLVSNAMKYSPAGSKIQIQSRLGNASVRATVRDQGVGIKSADLERVFSRYERVEAGPSQKVVGTGLGLAITREILNLHHGRIWVESGVGAGSTFHFELPLK